MITVEEGVFLIGPGSCTYTQHDFRASHSFLFASHSDVKVKFCFCYCFVLALVRERNNKSAGGVCKIPDTRANGCASAVRATRGFNRGTHAWQITIGKCSDYSFIGFVDDSWNHFQDSIGKSAGSWGTTEQSIEFLAAYLLILFKYFILFLYMK